MSGGCRVSPHSSRSVLTNLDVSSEPELIQGNTLRAEPFASGSHEMYQSQYKSWYRAVGNKPKTFAGGHELLVKHQELSGSAENHRTLRRVEPIEFQRQVQKDKELVQEPKSFIHRQEEEVGNDLSFGERRLSGVYQLQTSSRNVQRQAQRTSEEA
ncbi:hypothetical protein O181_122922 [Austropuccinia psidii MF-1]|uniref:Uncharacterized protein n=1 Tax=Austropuccinia psidii MF-1 TaxID=1389203 RepID=A0A9Q3Q4X7_9BASI|nr:hypothetical protein [Austropuccinia psidii MF-1]